MWGKVEVSSHLCFPDDIHWDAGRAINAKSLLGAADIPTEAAKNCGFDVVLVPTDANPYHAELQGWSDDKSVRIEKARDLAEASSLVEAR